MLFQHQNYRHYLRDVLTSRVTSNRAYSLRAFARDIGLAPSTMTEILNGKRNLSAEKAFQVAQNLRLQNEETEYFCLLVQLNGTKKDELKSTLQSRLHVLQPTEKTHDLSVDQFRLISEWYHYAILEILQLKAFDQSPKNIGRRLGISSIEVEAALERLTRLKLIKADNNGRFSKSKNRVAANGANPNTALRKFNKQMLEKAIESIETQTLKEKFIGSETIPFDPSQLDEAKELAEEFFNKLIKLSARGKNRTEVYNFGVQFFNLTKAKDLQS